MEITGRSGGSISITVRKALTKSLLYDHNAAIHIKSHTQPPSLTHSGIKNHYTEEPSHCWPSSAVNLRIILDVLEEACVFHWNRLDMEKTGCKDNQNDHNHDYMQKVVI